VPGGAAYAANEQVERSNWRVHLFFALPPHLTPPLSFFLAYLLYDLLHVLAAFPRLGGADTAAHHCAFLLSAVVAGTQRAFSFAFGWRAPESSHLLSSLTLPCRLILCEASTPLLNLRWLLKSLKREGCDAQLTAFARRLGFSRLAGLDFAVDMLFFAAFLAVRVVGYSAGLVHLLRARWLGYLDPLPRRASTLMLSLVCAGYGLNLVWLRYMVKLATRSAARAAAPAEVVGEKKVN